MTVAYRDIISRNIDAPTKERFEQGGFELRQLEKGEGKVLVATDPTPLLKAHSKGKLTDRQCDAGLWYEFAYGLVWGGEVGGRRDPLDMTPRGSQVSCDATPMYLHYKDMLQKVDDRLLLETKAEYNARMVNPLGISSARSAPLKVGKWGTQRQQVIRSVCGHSASIGKIERTRRRYQLLCEGLDVIHDVVL